MNWIYAHNILLACWSLLMGVTFILTFTVDYFCSYLPWISSKENAIYSLRYAVAVTFGGFIGCAIGLIPAFYFGILR